MQGSADQTISIKRARCLLGKSKHQFTDDQVRDILVTLQLLARQQLGYNGSKEVNNVEQ